MKSFGDLHRETRAVHLDFLRVEVKTALTLLEIAATTKDLQTRARTLQKASEAHASVLRSAAKVMMTSAEKEELRGSLLFLELRLGSLRSSGLPKK